MTIRSAKETMSANVPTQIMRGDQFYENTWQTSKIYVGLYQIDKIVSCITVSEDSHLRVLVCI